MSWISAHSGALMLVAASLTTLGLVISWGDGIPPLAVIRKGPGALRLVAGGLFLIGFGNLVMWTPGVITALAASHYLGDWGLLFCWPGLIVGFCLLKLVHKPALAVYRVIAGGE